ncbi:ABC transporter permease [Pseudalkalibacillus berkeleyi]|uniref:ABC transporter permease n=1 Tax=Pseudalkalibacillus berkeleyi TaxID=1069813 RepID=A0ABS9GV57_9BACL|nr:ABC transporter permease [Pseudalkalibacillus berkeleyi]MCF6136723.1 ABC transporter permease [Pseudalkalibacillus berkeleyi]
MRIKALTIRIIKQFFHDKRTLAMMLVAPLLILTIISLVFNGEDVVPAIGGENLPSPVIEKLKEADIDYKEVSEIKAESEFRSGELDGWVTLKDQQLRIILEGSDPGMNQRILATVKNVLQPSGQGKVEPEIEYYYGDEDMTSFDNFGPVLIGFFAFFFVFLIAGVSFLRERTGGTLERLMASPVKKSEVVIGYLLGFGFFTVIQSILIVFYSIYVLDLLMIGDFLWVVVITLLCAFTALSLGTLLSAYAQNELQMIQFIPIVVVPQVFFSGLFDLDSISNWVSWIGPITPLYYAAEALRDVMIRGLGFEDIAFELMVLLGFSLFFSIANIFALRKYRSF